MGLAAKELACAGASYKFSCVDYGAPPREDCFWRSLDVNSLEHRIVHTHVVGFCADDLLFIGVENYEVGVRAYGDGSFAGIEAEKFCGGGGNELDETVGRETLAVDAAGVDEAEAVFDARAAVGDFREVVLA